MTSEAPPLCDVARAYFAGSEGIVDGADQVGRPQDVARASERLRWAASVCVYFNDASGACERPPERQCPKVQGSLVAELITEEIPQI